MPFPEGIKKSNECNFYQKNIKNNRILILEQIEERQEHGEANIKDNLPIIKPPNVLNIAVSNIAAAIRSVQRDNNSAQISPSDKGRVPCSPPSEVNKQEYSSYLNDSAIGDFCGVREVEKG